MLATYCMNNFHQCLLMRLMKYKPAAVYVPGKTLLTADALSWSPQTYTKEETDTHSEVECYVDSVAQGIPASPSRMESIRIATVADSALHSVFKFIRRGWPEYSGNAPPNVTAYMKVKNELSEADGHATHAKNKSRPNKKSHSSLHLCLTLHGKE